MLVTGLWKYPPPIVKLCHASLEKFVPEKDGYEIIDITLDNLNNYITLPDFIMNKFKKGVISYAHLSDIIRLELLIKYGGFWIDSTCFLTGKIPKLISSSQLFLFQDINYLFEEGAKGISNWFIYANSNNNILILTRNLLYHYWKNSNTLADYFIFHFFFTKISIKLFNKEWDKVKVISNNTSQELHYLLFKKYSKEDFDFVASQIFVHKLTYKHNNSLFNQSGTLYKKLLQNYNIEP